MVELSEGKSVKHAPTHSHLLISTTTNFHSFLTNYHSFLAYSHPLPLMFLTVVLILSPPSSIRSFSHPFPVHIQILSSNPTHHLPFQPIPAHIQSMFYVLSCFTYLCAYVSSSSMCSFAYGFLFHALYCPCLYTLRHYVYVNTSGQTFIYNVSFKNTLGIPSFFSQC